MADRLQNESIEAVKTGIPHVRLERESVDAIKVGVPHVRLEREAVEAVKLGVPDVRLQRESLEVVLIPGTADPTNVRLNQCTLEIVVSNTTPVVPQSGGTFPCNSFANGTGPSPYYLSLITSEYQGSANFLNWLGVVLGVISDIQQLFCGMVSNFDLDTAVGAQLDIIGQLIGANRVVGFQPTGGVSPTLDDVSYKIYLKAKIAQNQWSGQLDSLYGIWTSLFPGGFIDVIDNQNMTCTILLSGAFTSIMQDLITNGYIIPRPEAVQYNFSFATLPIFGFDQNNTFVAGFDLGHLG